MRTLATQYALRVPAEIAEAIRWDAFGVNADALVHRRESSEGDSTVTYVWELGPTDPVREPESAPRLTVCHATD